MTVFYDYFEVNVSITFFKKLVSASDFCLKIIYFPTSPTVSCTVGYGIAPHPLALGIGMIKTKKSPFCDYFEPTVDELDSTSNPYRSN